MCCGKARASVSHGRISGAPAPARSSVASGQSSALLSNAAGQSVILTYVGKTTAGIVVRGPASGQQYAFSSAQPIRAVEVRDAAVLLRTGYFRQK
jgi:hypothetical protein